MLNTVVWLIIAGAQYVIKGLIRAVEWIYPPCCPFCDESLRKGEKERKICRSCQEKLVYITTKNCMTCGKPLNSGETEYCYDCIKYGHYYHQARSVLSYQGNTKDSIFRFKYSNRRQYAEFFGEEIVRMLGRWIEKCEVDLIIPIPLHTKKLGERGYNQAEILAKYISRNMRILYADNILVKSIGTFQQKELDRLARRKNMEAAFSVTEWKYLAMGKNILLVDDVYTTGATVDAAAKILRKEGANKIYVVTVAIGG